VLDQRGGHIGEHSCAVGRATAGEGVTVFFVAHYGVFLRAAPDRQSGPQR
jgi:hypothetical protein